MLVEFQLGWGFTLNAVGGLLGIRRTVNVDVLRAGLKNRALDAILFPPDPVANAPQILSLLRNVFPPTPTRHILGLIFRIGWGTPQMVTLELGIVLEVEPRSPTNWQVKRLILLGQIEAVLPTKGLGIIDLHLDALGVVDFTQDDVSLDATLFNSRLYYFVVSGDAALRANFGVTKCFVLAVGGVHPAFRELPPDFPALSLVSIALATSNKFRLRGLFYTAMTSNTAQFGGRVEVYAKEGSFSLEGWLAFEALFYFRPFRFVADLSARVAIKKSGHTLLSAGLDMSFSGPAPWHARGRVTFRVCGFKHSVDFEKTIGQDADQPALETVDVGARLEEAARDPRNWTGDLPDGRETEVILRETGGAGICVHPSSDLRMRQTIVPLNLSIDRFGEAEPAAERRFSFTAITVQGTAVPARTETEHFAAAQFFDLSDEEKLARPSFERFEAGVRLATAMRPGKTEAAPLTFQTYLIDPEYGAAPQRIDDYAPAEDAVRTAARFGPAGSAVLRRSGRAKYRGTVTPIAVAEAEYVIAAKADLSAIERPAAAAPANHWYAVDYLRRQAREDAARARELQLVRA